MYNINTNNIKIIGKLKKINKLYKKDDNTFYSLEIDVERKSKIYDNLEVIASHKLLQNIKEDDILIINGNIRTRNYEENNYPKTELYILAQDVICSNNVMPNENNNLVTIDGVVCKKPNYRQVTNREITDLLIAVNRKYNKSDYIPCIAWGINAKYTKNFEVGDKVKIQGRFQSREGKNKRYYDLSITKIEKSEEV